MYANTSFCVECYEKLGLADKEEEEEEDD